MRQYLNNYVDLRKSFVFYGAYHHEWRNQVIHVLFVPFIFCTALGFLSMLQITPSVDVSHIVAGLYVLSFIAMEPTAGTLYAPLIALMRFGGAKLAENNMSLAIGIHIVGWVSQIVAHRFFERRHPAFHEDPLQAIHAAVFFVWLEVLYYGGYKPKEKALLEELIKERLAKMKAEEASHAQFSAKSAI